MGARGERVQLPLSVAQMPTNWRRSSVLTAIPFPSRGLLGAGRAALKSSMRGQSVTDRP